MSPVKLAFIGPLLMKLTPHFFALSETKTRMNAASNLPIHNYEIFEEKAVPCAAPSHLSKWGNILGVHKDLQIVAHVPLSHEPLKGRVVCINVVVPSLSSSSSFIHRVFSVYTPCDPGADDLSLNFWPCLTDMVRKLKTSWSLFGDLNATVAAFERASDNVLARCMFNEFLKNTHGTDLWQKCPDRNRFIDWTCRGWHSTEGGNIIDHVVVSGHCLLDSEISTDQTWVPGSDHRAVKAKIILKSLIPDQSVTSSTLFVPYRPLPPPRIKYPSKDDKYKFALFADSVDCLVASNSPSFLTEITSDKSYVGRYNLLTSLIEQAAVNTFGRNKPYHFVERQVTSPCIRELVALIRHLGGAISRSKGGSRQMSYGSHKIFNQYLAQFTLLDKTLFKSVTEYMVDVRRNCHKELYAAKKAEILRQAR